MNTKNSTPTPWTMLPRPMSMVAGSTPQWVITGDDGRALETAAIAHGDANAALIIRAANSHAELVAALSSIAQYASELVLMTGSARAVCIRDEARAALARAKA